MPGASGSKPQNEVPLGFFAQGWIWRVVISVGCGGVGSALYLAHLSLIQKLGWSMESLARERRIDVLARESFAFAVLAAVVACGLWWLRQPRGARITWDHEAITEWDGEAVRACIPWAAARQNRVNVVISRKGVTRPGGTVVQVSDGEGRLISANASAWTARWMRARRLVGGSEALFARVAGLPAGGGLTADRDSLRRPAFFLWSLLYLAGCVAPVGGLLYLAWEKEAAIAIALGSLSLFLFTVLVPVRELFALRAPSLARAEHLELVSNEGPMAIARGAGGERLSFDTSMLFHTDARIATRRGGAWVALKDGKATAIETDVSRKARRTLQLAVALEVALRLGIVVAMVLLLVLAELARRKEFLGY